LDARPPHPSRQHSAPWRGGCYRLTNDDLTCMAHAQLPFWLFEPVCIFWKTCQIFCANRPLVGCRFCFSGFISNRCVWFPSYMLCIWLHCTCASLVIWGCCRWATFHWIPHDPKMMTLFSSLFIDVTHYPCLHMYSLIFFCPYRISRGLQRARF